MFATFFLIYYIYLIYTNAVESSWGYVACYSALLVVSIVSFIVEITLMNWGDDTKEDKKTKKGRKKRRDTFAKVVKYLVKIGMLVITFYDIKANGATPTASIMFNWSLILLSIQLTFELIMWAIRTTFRSPKKKEVQTDSVEEIPEEENNKRKRR